MESHSRAAAQERLAGAARENRIVIALEGSNPQIYSPVDPQLSRMHPLLALAQAKKLAMVSLCLGTRKRTQAWNPGSFGCRGLLVYGQAKGSLSTLSALQRPRCSQWSALPPLKIDKLSYGARLDQLDILSNHPSRKSGHGSAFPARADIRRQQPCPPRGVLAAPTGTITVAPAQSTRWGPRATILGGSS